MTRVYLLCGIATCALLLAGLPASAATQKPQTDYDRVMNSVDKSTEGAFGQPQPDQDAVVTDGSSGDDTDQNSSTKPETDATQQDAAAANAAAAAQAAYAQQSAYGNAPYGNTVTGAGNGLYGRNANPYAGGAPMTSAGQTGLGAYNSSPYNTAPSTVPAPAQLRTNTPTTPTYTGQ